MKRISFLLLLTIAIVSPVYGQSSVSMATYHAAPFGSYKRLQLIPRAALGDPCERGSMYINDTDHSLYFCHDDGTGAGTWDPFSGSGSVEWDHWNQMHVFLKDTSTPLKKKVGIGTKAPDLKLTLDLDGGILAKGTFNDPSPGASMLNTVNLGTSFLWYPKKAAIRAGYVDAAQWSNALIGNHSVAFGKNTTASGHLSSVSGGENNLASGSHSNIGGGRSNQAIGNYSTVSGGKDNIASGSYSSISGGESVSVSGAYSTGSGGYSNGSLGNYATVSGGQNHEANDHYITITGGKEQTINGDYSTITGGQDNETNGEGNTILGGYKNFTSLAYATVSGGGNNIASGGVAGYATVSGGENNTALGDYSTVGGGKDNTAEGAYSTTVGGSGNSAEGDFSFVGGGQSNEAKGIYSAIVAGNDNEITALGTHSFIGGGASNTASGIYSVIPGGQGNTVSGEYSWAGGQNMGVSGNRTFAWGNSTNAAQDDVFVIGTGNVGVGTSSPWERLHISGGDMRISGANNTLIITNPSPVAPGPPNIKQLFRLQATGEFRHFDLAELFETSEDVEVGDLLVIDETKEMKLKKCHDPYDKKVVGIVSAAPAILFEGSQLQLSPESFSFTKGTKPPVALSGRVLCKVSLENGPVKHGDLLTTSSIPGHAMKADRNKKKSFGKIVGKALESFDGGPNGETTGLIAVFATLQ